MLRDTLGRPLGDLRISVTDRCNFRCSYCMPSDDYKWIERKELLSFEEITRLAGVFLRSGARRIRITGGEPCLRRGLGNLIARIARLRGLEDLSLTTNGRLLAEKAAVFASAGLKRVNVSIDSLDPDTYRAITRSKGLKRVLEGLFAARRAGLAPIKINTVVVRGLNDGGILDMAAFAREHDFPLRFIEYMDAGNANGWQSERLIAKQEILRTIHARFPLKEAVPERGSSPSIDYGFADGRGDIGVIASVTEPFCSTCTRARLTADGRLVTCLFSEYAHDLKGPLRSGAADEEILELIHAVWERRSDRYSEQRLEELHSEQGYNANRRKKIEMIRLGG